MHKEYSGKLIPMLIDGIHIPLTLPFTRDGGLYLRKLDYNVGRYSLTPATGFVSLSPDSEADSLSDAEIEDVLRVVSNSSAPEKVLIATISKSSVRGALAIAELAATSGFDAVLLAAPPQSANLSSDEHLLFFRAVADRSPLPVLLSSSARSQECQLSVQLIAELARHPNVIGVYEDGLTLDRYNVIAAATGDIHRSVTVTPVFAPVTRRMLTAGDLNSASSAGFVTAESLASGTAIAKFPSSSAMKTRSKTVGFQVIATGTVRGFVELLEAGAAGAMLAMSACAPQACHEAYTAFKDGDRALAAEKGQRLIEADGVLSQAGIAGIKYGCDWNGYYGGSPRLPRLPLNAASKTNVERVLAGIRN